MSEIELSEKQKDAVGKIEAWFDDPDAKTYALAGYAGTGKTTLAKHVKKVVQSRDNLRFGGSVIFGAYTGKAVNVLREKGCGDVTTIHGGLYRVADKDKGGLVDAERRIEEHRAAGRFTDMQDAMFDLQRQRVDHRKPGFTLSEQSAFKQADLVIIDEYSMLPHKIISDLQATAKKILYLGDPFQLPPIEGECPIKPDHFIEEIHRQALDSSIIRFSKDVREGRGIPRGEHGDLDYINQHTVTPALYLGADQIICGRNNTRNAINAWYRTQNGNGQYTLPVKGEKIICLKNNRELGLFNGMIGTAESDAEKPYETADNYTLNFEGIEDIKVWDGDIMGRAEDYNFNDFRMKSLNRFDFGYAITCHKSQGSEFNHVVILNEPVGKTEIERARWLYTAITRGKKKVTLLAA